MLEPPDNRIEAMLDSLAARSIPLHRKKKFGEKAVCHRQAREQRHNLFSQFGRLGAGFCMNFFVGLFTVLRTLLLIIPGIVKSFNYAMTPFILAEHPEMRSRDAITESRHLMDGNKWRLFCLQFSFIGWYQLCLAPIVIAFGVVYTGAIDSFAVFLCILPASCFAFILSQSKRPSAALDKLNAIYYDRFER